MNAEQYLKVALGGNMNIGTLKPFAWHEIMEDYARYKIKEHTLQSVPCHPREKDEKSEHKFCGPIGLSVPDKKGNDVKKVDKTKVASIEHFDQNESNGNAATKYIIEFTGKVSCDWLWATLDKDLEEDHIDTNKEFPPKQHVFDITEDVGKLRAKYRKHAGLSAKWGGAEFLKSLPPYCDWLEEQFIAEQHKSALQSDSCCDTKDCQFWDCGVCGISAPICHLRTNIVDNASEAP